MEPHYAGILAYVLSGNNERILTARMAWQSQPKEGGRNGGKGPEQIYASADVLASLKAENDPLIALKKTMAGYSFDGVAIEPKPRQSLPFVLRP